MSADADFEPVLDPTSNPWRRDPAMNHRSDASREEWGDYYNVHPQFLPWAHSKLNGFEALRKLTPFFESRPTTSKQVSVSRITSHLGIDYHTGEAYFLEDVALISGWWRGGSNPASGAYYCNPDYVHGHSDDDYLDKKTHWDDDAGRYVNERFDLAIQAARFGLSGSLLAPAFGVESSHGPRWWLTRRGFDWEEQVEDGRRTMARTFKTINAWGYSYAEIAPAFGLARSTVTDRVRQYASGFEPPRDPNYRRPDMEGSP